MGPIRTLYSVFTGHLLFSPNPQPRNHTCLGLSWVLAMSNNQVELPMSSYNLRLGRGCGYPNGHPLGNQSGWEDSSLGWVPAGYDNYITGQEKDNLGIHFANVLIKASSRTGGLDTGVAWKFLVVLGGATFTANWWFWENANFFVLSETNSISSSGVLAFRTGIDPFLSPEDKAKIRRE